MVKRKRGGEREVRCTLRRRPADSSAATEATLVDTGDSNAKSDKCGCDFAHDFVRDIVEGRNAKVYEAEQLSTGIIVAVKEAKPDGDSAAIARAGRKEVRIMQLLAGHKHVVRFVTSCTCKAKGAGGNGALMMELCTGTLDGFRFRQYPTGLPPEVLRRVLRQLVSAMAHLEDKGVWHCDLKPENILIKHQGGRLCTKLGDFGNSRDADETCRMTQTEMQTPSHRAPEVHLKAALAAAANGE
mmetsp:Transcript_46050/g.114500  ORF Transcript_46050/g.114500 Transcript_46050/m.114500 type:complete len:242 (-) Transcript_46050:332-1057(-)